MSIEKEKEKILAGKPGNIKEFHFKPNEDITAYELAKILEICGSSIVEHVYLSLPEDCKRHFK